MLNNLLPKPILEQIRAAVLCALQNDTNIAYLPKQKIAFSIRQNTSDDVHNTDNTDY